MQVLSPVNSFHTPNWNNYKYVNTKKNNPLPSQVSFSGHNEYVKLLDKFIDLFSLDSYKLEETLKSVLIKKQYSSNGQLFNFQVKLPNGNTLAVKKFFRDGGRIKDPYIAIKEFKNPVESTAELLFKEYIGIDLNKKELIYLDRSGNPIRFCNEHKRIPLYHEDHAVYEYSLERYLKQIFPEETPKAKVPKDTGGAGKNAAGNPQKQKPDPLPKSNNIGQTPIQTQPVTKVKKTATRHDLTPKVPDGRAAKLKSTAATKAVQKVSATAGILEDNVKSDIKTITDIMQKIHELNRKDNSTYNRGKWFIFRADYKKTISPQGINAPSGVTFKYSDGETLRVMWLPKTEHYTRFIHTDKQGTIKVILIEDGEKVVSNLNPAKIMNIPQKPQYYSSGELNSLPVAEYAKFLRENLEEYYKAGLEAIGNVTPRKSRRSPRRSPVTPAVSTVTPDVPKAEPAEQTGQTLQQILSNMMGGEISPETVAGIARKDAQRLAQTYVDTFIKQFQESVQEGLKNLQSLFGKN